MNIDTRISNIKLFYNMNIDTRISNLFVVHKLSIIKLFWPSPNETKLIVLRQ